MSKIEVTPVLCSNCIHYSNNTDMRSLAKCKRFPRLKKERCGTLNLIAEETKDEKESRLSPKWEYCTECRTELDFLWDLSKILFSNKHCGPKGKFFELNKKKLVDRL